MIGVIGYLCEDFFPEMKESFEFVPGKLQNIGSMPGSPGGAVGNTGGALCRMNVPVRLGSLTADDAIGLLLRTIVGDYKPSGGVEQVILPGKATGTTVVINPPGQDRMFLCCRGVNDLMTSETFPDKFFDGLDILHYGYPSLSLSMAANDGEETKKLFIKCRNKGILTSLDLAQPAVGTVFYEMDWTAFFRNVLPYVDLFCPSLDELQFMLRDKSSSPEELVRQLFAFGCGAVLLKMGSDGLLVATSDSAEFEKKLAKFGPGSWRNIRCQLPPEKIKVVNATGAGDSAIAGFLAAVDSGVDAASAARLASKAAAARISSPEGIRGIPLFRDLLSNL